MSEKIFISASSQTQDGIQAAGELAAKVKEGLQGKPCDLAVLFVSESYEGQDLKEFVRAFRTQAGPRHLVGCNACGIIADSKEIEMKPALSVLAMHLPEVAINPFKISQEQLETLESARSLIDHLGIGPEEQPKFICLADPISCDVSYLMQLFDAAYPAAPVTGGLASAAVVQKPNLLWLEGEFFETGAVGFSLSGDIHVSTLVSQGCRPIGEPLAITKSEKNIVYEIAGKPALEVLKETYEKLSVEDQELARTALFVGLAMDEHREKFVRGDFLIRNIVGGDQQQGAIAVGEILQDGQTIQFQLRDRKASDEDLKNLLDKMLRNEHSQKEGALLVSCCGRGKNLFMESDHDAGLIQSMRGPIPMAGFFANGEFGPINRKNYIHGYTSSLTIIS